MQGWGSCPASGLPEVLEGGCHTLSGKPEEAPGLVLQCGVGFQQAELWTPQQGFMGRSGAQVG